MLCRTDIQQTTFDQSNTSCSHMQTTCFGLYLSHSQARQHKNIYYVLICVQEDAIEDPRSGCILDDRLNC